jgi:hypothetical protein
MLVLNTNDIPTNPDATPTFRIYGPNGFVELGNTTPVDSKVITDATNANPIVITSAGHGLSDGTRVYITSVAGNTAANGTWKITGVDVNRFSIPATGNGVYTFGGTWQVVGLFAYRPAILGSKGYEVGEMYQVLLQYAISLSEKGQLHSFVVT